MKKLKYSATQYLLDDHQKTLFPLQLSRVLVEKVPDLLYKEIDHNQKGDPKDGTGFLSQIRCYSSKRGLNLRRTIKLDPVAELYLYDLIYRQRNRFFDKPCKKRRSYGYRFLDNKDNRPIPATTSYGEFRKKVRQSAARFKFHASLDISTYFNSLYHHDLVGWFENENKNDTVEVQRFGSFFREITAGRSVDCLPQGLHPSKVIGAAFLSGLDEFHAIQSRLMLRFMDDIYLFDNNMNIIEADIIAIQRYIGENGLSLNAEKTKLCQGPICPPWDLEDVKVELLELRREALEAEYGILLDSDAPEIAEENEPLTTEQIDYLTSLLDEKDIDESDAELVLSVLRERTGDYVEHLVSFLERFPALSRVVHSSAKYVQDKNELLNTLLQMVKQKRPLTEDQLFWIAKIVEDHLLSIVNIDDLLIILNSHPAATTLSRAKLLEIPHKSLDDMRAEYFTGGRSDWLAWCAALGTRNVPKSKRNHLLGYFGKASRMNRIISICVKGLD